MHFIKHTKVVIYNMFFDKKTVKSHRVTSGASRKKLTLKFPLLTNQKIKSLSSRIKNLAGRTSSGRISVFSKGSRSLKSRIVNTNKCFRDTSISIIVGFTVNPINSSLKSLVYASSGRVCYIPSTEQHFLFNLTYFSSIFNSRSELFRNTISLKKYIKMQPSFFIIRRLPKNQPVSNLEIVPGRGIQYAQSPGSKSTIVKMDTRTGSSLVRLPSGVRKVFSIYSIGSLGKSSLKDNKDVNVTSAGSRVVKGFKPQTRGVAKNPIDHPHGGRTKSIKYPRTPWGKTTKFK
jgi:large subunit ribosomal protein L2